MSVIEKELDHGNDIGWATGQNLDQKLDRLDIIKKQLNDIHKKSADIPELLTTWKQIHEKFQSAVRKCANIEDEKSKNLGTKATTYKVNHF